MLEARCISATTLRTSVVHPSNISGSSSSLGPYAPENQSLIKMQSSSLNFSVICVAAAAPFRAAAIARRNSLSMRSVCCVHARRDSASSGAGTLERVPVTKTHSDRVKRTVRTRLEALLPTPNKETLIFVFIPPGARVNIIRRRLSGSLALPLSEKKDASPAQQPG